MSFYDKRAPSARWTLALMPLAVVLWSRTASATRDFPNVIRYHLGLSYEPPCSVCHLKGNTGPGTVQTPMGISLRARGMVARDESSVANALDALEADGTDSDGDGQSDIDELRAQVDPNSAGNTQLAASNDPSFGCGGGQEGDGRRGAAGPLVAIAMLGWLRRRKRRVGDRGEPRKRS